MTYMAMWIRMYGPGNDDDGADGGLEDEDLERMGEDDSTILGAGGTAGGLSGDGERTDEYDAAVFGLDD
ncbi:hypothetical protein GCM10027577_04540 [Spirosoma fluminis]